MPRPAPSAFSGELTKSRTRPFWAVEINFSTPLRLCNREAMTIGGNSFQHVGLEVNLADATLSIINEQAQFTSTFLTESTDGVRAQIWQGYGDGSTWALSELQERFDGELGPISIGQDIGIRLRAEKPKQTPGLVIGDVISADHLIPDGAVASTSAGKVKLSTT